MNIFDQDITWAASDLQMMAVFFAIFFAGYCSCLLIRYMDKREKPKQAKPRNQWP